MVCQSISRGPDNRRSRLRDLDAVERGRESYDALMEKGGQFDIHAAGMLALDVHAWKQDCC